jgi:GH25 family lysozyme M1 (1,4-beta-N-acetylmuramidase)
MDENGQTPATYKDYSSTATYYYQSEEKDATYYGWQTIDGTRYYFDKDGNKVTGTQVIMENQYNFGSDGALLTSGYGIDVSKWQGSIDWAQASSAVSFAIIRAGFRGSNGGISVDSYAGTNITNAKANGVKVGLYFYSRAVNEVQAVEEASVAISIARQYGGISLPIYIDMEADEQKSLSTAERDAIVLAFCATVKNAGYQAGVYANKNWLTNYLTPSSYTGYSIWCAQYNTSCTYGGRYDIWQYTSKGSIPGISGNVDLDQSFF